MHQTDIVNFMLNKTVPLSCMASGGIYRWTAATIAICPIAFTPFTTMPTSCRSITVAISATIHSALAKQICGNEGTIRVMNRQDLYFEHETYNSRRRVADRAPPTSRRAQADPPERPKPISTKRTAPSTISATSSSRCRARKSLIAPPPVGQQAAISGHLATLSFKNGKKILWDEKARSYSFT